MVTLYKSSREYVDLDFSFDRHPLTNNVTIKKSTNAIKQSILHLLKLKTGDKPFHPEIRSPIYDYLFENASVIVQVVLESEILKYLNVYEPRIQVLEVKVSFPDNNSIKCNVIGNIVNMSEPFNVNILIERLR